MTINHNNIEEYILDYLEGNLDPLLTAELMAFMAENPEYEQYILNKELKLSGVGNEVFTGKPELRKNFTDVAAINDKNFDEFCIAASEGILDDADVRRLNDFIGDDLLKIKTLELYRALKLTPDASVKYPDKRGLKKSEGGIFLKRYMIYGLAAIAASIALLLILTVNHRPVSVPASGSPITENNQLPGIITGNEEILIPAPSAKNASEQAGVRKQYRIANGSQTGSAPAEKIEVQSVPENYADPFNPEVLQPVTGRINSLASKELTLPESGNVAQIPASKPKKTFPVDSDNLIVELFSRLNIWKTAETALDGFNYLTEAQVSISKTTDENGRLTGLSVNTESYTIAGKIR